MMIEVMSDIIDPTQLAYIKKRFIGEGIKLIEGIIEYVIQKRMKGYMLAVDFLKAFDSYEWEFWEAALRVFGFPECFIKLLKRHYKNITSCVVNGGTSTRYFSIKRGIKQGDPPSGLIFVLGIELFSIKVRSTAAIEGIQVNKQEIKLTAFADDVNHFLKNIASVKRILAELEIYGEISGLVCNLAKCEAMAIGENKPETITYNSMNIKWVDKMKITGITFGNDSEQNRKEDVEEAISKMKTQLQIWSARDLSVLGKIQIVKTFGISQILYIANMLPFTNEEIVRVDNLISNFVWNNKPAKVKHATMIADFDYGGLKYPNIRAIFKTQRIMWIKRYFCSPYHPWKLIFEWQIEKVGGNTIFENTHLDNKRIAKQQGLMEFYADLIIAWGEYNRTDISPENVLNQNLFFNLNFRNPIGQSLTHCRFVKNGITQIKDITVDNRLLDFEEIKVSKNLKYIDLLPYIGILSMIPRDIKQLIRTAPQQSTIEPMAEKLQGKNSKTVYRKLNNKAIQRPTSEQKFIGYNITEENWKNIYKLPFLVTIDSKSRAFQFKISHNIYYTNKKLNLVKIKDSSACSFCKSEEESLQHLFIECKYVKPIWNDLQIFMNESFRDDEKLFGKYEHIDDNAYDLDSHITIITKQSIHDSRIRHSLPSFNEVKNKIIEIENIERQIALRNFKLASHQSKWAKLSSP